MTDHHQRVGFQSDQDLYEDLFGRGDGDPDHTGMYPGEQEVNELQESHVVDEKVGQGDVSF